MNDTLIINGVTYKAVKEEKKPERLEGWVVGKTLATNWGAHITKTKTLKDTKRMVELRSGEIIVSEDELIDAISEHVTQSLLKYGSVDYRNICEALGFKKDGE